MSPDPLLFTEVPQQFHPYNYAHANPSTLTDPTGLSVFGGILGGGGLLASFGLRNSFLGVISRAIYQVRASVKQAPQATSVSSWSSWGASSYGRSSYSSPSSGRSSYSSYGMYSRAAVGVAYQPTMTVSMLQKGLDWIGLAPGVGEFFDGANAVVYVAQKDWGNAFISAAAMVPFWGTLGTGARIAKNTARETKEISQAIADKTTKNVGNSTPRFIANSTGEVLDTSRVTIPQGKFGYLLNHPSKSGVFRDRMGFDQSSLEPALRNHLTANFGHGSPTEPMKGGGIQFTVKGPMTGPNGRTWDIIRSGWGIDNDGTVRLLTATP